MIALYNIILFTGLIYFSYKTYKEISSKAENQINIRENVTMYVNKYGELYEQENQLINK